MVDFGVLSPRSRATRARKIRFFQTPPTKPRMKFPGHWRTQMSIFKDRTPLWWQPFQRHSEILGSVQTQGKRQQAGYPLCGALIRWKLAHPPSALKTRRDPNGRVVHATARTDPTGYCGTTASGTVLPSFRTVAYVDSSTNKYRSYIPYCENCVSTYGMVEFVPVQVEDTRKRHFIGSCRRYSI